MSRSRFSRPGLLLGIAVLLAGFPPTASAQPHVEVVDPAVPPGAIADVVLILEPDRTMALDVPAPVERVIRGRVLRLDRGVLPRTIVHTPHTLIAPLERGVPVKVYLKQFRGRDAHYVIGIFPASDGDER